MAINKGFNESVEDAKVGVDLGVFAIVDYILQIRLGKKEFWAMDEYEQLYTSKRLKFFDWMIALLEDSKCQEVEGGILLSSDNEHSKYIQYYYQMVDYGSKEYNGTLADMINFSHNAQKLVGNTLALDQNKTLYIQAMLKNSSEISDAIFAGGTSLSKVITCNYPQSPTSPLDEENITRPIPPVTPPEPIDSPPPPTQRDETCDLWDIRYAN